MFDPSRDREQTIDYEVGTDRVIKGWEKGLIGLCKGAKATLIIPAEEGYGKKGAAADGMGIPGEATLHFDIEVIDVSLEKW